MRLAPLEHPSWLMVATIGCTGGAVTARMGGSPILCAAFAGAAAAFALAAVPAARRELAGRPGARCEARQHAGPDTGQHPDHPAQRQPTLTSSSSAPPGR